MVLKCKKKCGKMSPVCVHLKNTGWVGGGGGGGGGGRGLCSLGCLLNVLKIPAYYRNYFLY